MSVPFRTEYVGPTNTKGARILVTSIPPVAGKPLRHAISYPHEATTPAEAHDLAASAFVARFFHLDTGCPFQRMDVGKGFIYSTSQFSHEVTL